MREESVGQPLDILVVDDEAELRMAIADALRDAGHRLVEAGDGAEGMTYAASRVFDVVLSDIRLPKMDGLSLFRAVREQAPKTDVILMTAYGQINEAVLALKEGAHDYLLKPFELDELLAQVESIAEQRRLARALDEAKTEIGKDRSEVPLVGRSPQMRRVLDMVTVVGASDAPVMILGESGTGKEIVARRLHAGSPRAAKPFIAVNCGALAETLIEAELFGHEKGAFTGAVTRREGRFKAADGGTLFLDEIAELPLSCQAKLLRVLQEGTFEPLGTNTTVKVDVRLLSATHRNLRERVRSGLFREDLYYRINVVEIPLPPLRERLGDLRLLLQHFLQRFTPKGQTVPTVSPAAWAALCQYSYPGNVREFSHAIAHAVVLSGGKEISVRHLPSTISAGAALTPMPDTVPANGARSIRPLNVVMKEFEREYLLRAIAHAHGRRAVAAEMLGISRKNLWEKLRAHGITDPEDERELG